ncbi:MAG: alpha/beta hydrolase [Leptolyngbyaceae cyanobacterium SL_7_1]|nr:alpha/beta hydrolase [Leptolyngbyaceae cyanobacterium SL_7_1]
MLQPPGFCHQSIAGSLGNMVYYTQCAPSDPNALWQGDVGRDRPTLVFLHGFGGGSSAYEWSKVYPAFAHEYRILAPDLIGWGRSAHPPRDYRVDDYLLTIGEFLEKTCPSPAWVVASSLTAAMTIRVAIAHPEHFQGLILTTPSGLSDFGNDYSRSFFAQLVSTPVLDRLLYSAGIATSAGIRNFLEQRQFARPERIYDEIVDAYLASAQQPNAEYSALAFVRGDLCFDLSQYIGRLTIPTAVIWGQKSQFTGPEIGQRLARENPQAIQALQILDDVGLTPQLELPSVTIGLIRQFIAHLATSIDHDAPREP